MSDFPEIEKILDKDYDHEFPDIPRTREFNREYIKAVKKICKPYGIFVNSIYEWGGEYCECSGFLQLDRKFCYFNSGDYRYNREDIFEHVLIRTAKDPLDFHGGPNHYTTLRGIAKKAMELFEEEA